MRTAGIMYNTGRLLTTRLNTVVAGSKIGQNNIIPATSRSERSVQPVSAEGFTKMSIYGMNMDLFSSSPIVILKVEDENRYLPIWIGQAEARSILFKLQNQEFVRPLTHDLALNLVSELGGSMERITVTELKDSTFFATIRVEIDGKSVEVDSRPSDAIALAIRSGAEIFASDEVIEEAGVVFEEAMEDTPEEEVVDKFKDWMNQVSPDDFK